MRVAIIVPRFPDATNSFTVTRSRALARSGIEVGIFYRSPGNKDFLKTPLFVSTYQASVRSYHYVIGGWPVQPLIALIRSLTSLRALHLASTYVKKALTRGYSFRKALGMFCGVEPLIRWNPDIYHIEASYMALGLVEPLSITGCPIIVSLRGADVDEKPQYHEDWRKWFQDSGKIDNLRFHSVSGHVRKKAIQWNVNPSRCPVIYQGIDPEDFESDSLPKVEICNSNGLIVVARLSKEKGVDIALRAIPLLKKKEMHLHVVGDGTERDALVRLSQELQIPDRIIFHGEESNDWVKAFLSANRKNHLYVQPSIFEAFGQSILEAMAAGIPVVAARTGGVPELVEQTGLLFDPGSPESLALHLEQLTEDRNLSKRLADMAKLRANTVFSAAREAEEFIEFYQLCLEQTESGSDKKSNSASESQEPIRREN